ncbi:RanBP2-type zinc finger protein [Acorus calamus]|uniref:RanBP2-type zinc finger protein n=1 Tax=Acorus calamus TaxID=4465 RepID=A0AAV9DXH0_ACOCL|nr:RanBP2-type zinc finger protein [Acorus calamus]
MESAEMVNRDSFGSKRSRNEANEGNGKHLERGLNIVPRKEGDWTCHKCGNVNFGFRTVCNRAKCAAPRPSASPRAGSTPIPGSYDRPPFFVGAPPPMPLGIGGGYGHPPSFPGMRYDYGQPGNAAGPYGLLSSYGPPGHIGGLGYGPGMSMDGYGFGYRGSPLPVTGAWPGGDLPDNNASRKRRGGPDGLSEGDWGPNRSSSGSKDTGSGPEGSWTCNKCGNLNYPFRTVCNRKGCSNEKPLSS